MTLYLRRNIVSIEANKKIIDELIGDESMYETLMEIMEPQIQLREKAIMKKGIQGAVDLLRDVGQRDDEIKESIMKKYNLTGEEAEEYIYTQV